ncbi:MAG: hypothetical protein SAJ37_18090 [Oscillatoria sp. PMC 1068.18]|nr:hypothetical protein [Oscillatoria sp. PMC 1076.18]MEC4990646.1 hypothetical protein [Oscillatoria sp. PMC 1068.18]
MSQTLTLELSDEVYTNLKQEAEFAGLSVSEWIIVSLTQQAKKSSKLDVATSVDREAARQRFRRHAGSVDLGYATKVDNESIEADLARAYSNEDKVGN